LFPGDLDRVAKLSLIDESGCKYVRMAHVACVGSHKINGVAALHTELLKQDTLRAFYDLWPDKFLNITNGVTPRRWMALCNSGLRDLITSSIGEDWIRDVEAGLSKLEPLAEDAEFQAAWRKVKFQNKERLAALIRKRTGIVVDPESIFDVQVKRIHEYKRQHLNVLHILTLYLRIKRNPSDDISARTFIFGGKSAPGYFMAKLIIKLINSVAEVINNDSDVADRIKVIFLPNFNVKNGHQIYPASDLSEQISTAGKEASGTGNMKFAMNGALTIGTLDGANIEIREEVGAENFFLFGLTAQEVWDLRAGGYSPRYYYENNEELRAIIDITESNHFTGGDKKLFRPLIDSLLHHDEYMVLADYQSYVDCQRRVAGVYGDKIEWTRMSILNTARMGKFSSDRAISAYCKEIWDAKPLKW